MTALGLQRYQNLFFVFLTNKQTAKSVSTVKLKATTLTLTCCLDIKLRKPDFVSRRKPDFGLILKSSIQFADLGDKHESVQGES